ncbi:hypothetical protein SAMN05216490_5016 [Mucilaginibacter mallensis]|uniref:Uncharacterized protein n=1 Tax=Mucilaginibacter mallensis TaxID=652787 RepID=A0A1H2CGF0_MUCMA|nr:hypothetical protein SAMN05216490_5016 [Mucilaginibacter mallensis]
MVGERREEFINTYNKAAMRGTEITDRRGFINTIKNKYNINNPWFCCVNCLSHEAAHCRGGYYFCLDTKCSKKSSQ